MREHRRDRNRLEDILSYAQNIVTFIGGGMTFDDFVADRRTYYSVAYNITIIGEASNMLTRHFCEVHAELPWRQIVDMRNVMVHGYLQMSDRKIWDTAVIDIPVLIKQVKAYIANIDWEQWGDQQDEYTIMDSNVYKNSLHTAQRLKKMGILSVEQIAEATGLTQTEVRKLWPPNG